MRTHSQNFRNAISTYGREVKHKITYWQNYGETELEDILSINSVTNADLLKTVMKELDFNSKKQLPKDTVINYKLGIKVNDEYEYIDFGQYKVKENDWNADTNSFAHVCYDMMLDTMIDYYTPSNVSYPITVNAFIRAITRELGFEFANYNIPFCNSQVLINEDHFSNAEYTFRDVLDYLAEIVAGWIIINRNGAIEIKYPTNTGEVFNGDFLRDVNITFKSKYGAVNSIVFARGGGSDTIYRKDDNDIATNGLHELRFDDNPFLEGTDRENFIDNVYNQLHGLEFYVMDINSPGICYLEVGDYFTFELNQNSAMKSGIAKSGLYKSQSQTGGMIKCLMLNDEIDFSSGINEYIYADEPMSSVTNYKTSSPTDNSIKNAIITTNKNAGQIVLKANADGKIVQVALDADARNGSEFNVKADNINLEGYTTINGGFSIDLDGVATMRGAKIQNGNIFLTDNGINSNALLRIDSNSTQCTSYYFSDGVSISKNNLNIGTSMLCDNYSSGIQCNKDNNSASFSCTNTYANAFITNTYDKYIAIKADSNNSSIVLMNGNNETYIDVYGITTPTLTQTSKEEYKKNFEKLVNAKEILKNTDIYKYNLKSDKDTDKKHIGFVIGDKFNYSEEITSKDNDGVDIYSMVSVLWQVVKEQEEEIKLLKERIDK